MARIPLRVYISEIEKLIENGQTQEAMAHCRYILKSYPKYIDIYRLMGNAQLESQHYSDAAYTLERVLTVIPDDFMAQIGMSLIREDEHNLDAAIYHMERAFEIQPSNKAIQAEVRRLYGRRDGVEPPKIRLTRGALIRMYLRGEQYQQGIAEAKTALAEEPERFDLQLLLARLYYLAGQKVQAAEVASSMAVSLPYCYEANRILAEVLQSSRPEDAKVYQDRLKAVDPYMMFISENAPTSAEVPEAAIQIERLEYQPSQEEAAQPDWTRTVGVAWDEQAENEAAPDWLAGESSEQKQQTISEFPEDLTVTEPAAEPAEIPDWMAAAGWGPSTGTAEEAPASTGTEEEGIAEEAAPSEAEIPDWLKEMAPETGAQEESGAQEQGEAEEDQGWLDNLLGVEKPAAQAEQPAAPVDAVAEQPTEETQQPEAVEVPDWLSGLGGAGAQDSMPSEPGQTPEWLQTGSAEEALPDWMQAPASAAESAEAAAGEELPDWLKTIGETQEPSEPEGETVETVAPAVEEQPAEEEVKAELVMPVSEAVVPEVTEETAPTEESVAAVETPGEDVDSALAWLESLAAKQGAVEGTLLVNPDERTEEMPEWLQKEAAQEEAAAPTPEATAESEETEPAAELAGVEESAEAVEETELPEWLQAGPVAETTAEQMESVEPAAEEAELPEWLKPEPEASTEAALDAVEEQAPESELWTGAAQLEAVSEIPLEEAAAEVKAVEPVPAEETQPDELPDWLKKIGQSEEAAPAAVEPEPEPAAQATRVEPAAAGGEDIDAALAWLESLAAKQGAEEGTLLVNPEERLETPPEWVQNAEEETPTAVEPEAAASEMITEETEAAQPEAAALEEAFMPVETIAESTEPVEETELAQPVEIIIEETPAAVEQAAEPVEEAPEAAVETASQELPEFLGAAEQVQEETREKTQPVSVKKPEPEAEAAVEEEQPQPAAELPGEWKTEAEAAAVPETTEETLPDWLQDLGSYSPVEAAPVEAMSTKEEALPEWLQEIEAEPAENLEQAQSAWQPEMAAETAVETAPVEKVEPEPEPEPETQPAAESKPQPVMESQPAPRTEPVKAAQAADGSVLELGQQALASGDVDKAVAHYNQLTQNGEHLEEVIHDLRDAIYRYPVNCDLYQALGDAYMRTNRIQDALEAYTKAEELLR